MQIPTSSGSVLHIDLSFFYFYQPIASDACVFVYVRVHVCNKIPIIHRPLYAPWSLIDGMPEIIYACYYYIYVYLLTVLFKQIMYLCMFKGTNIFNSQQNILLFCLIF